MSLPRYPEYRDSGVDWIGQVPSSWGVDRLKASITSCKNGIWGDEPKGDESDIDCVRVADFDRVRLVVDGVVPTQRSVTRSERIGRVLQRGDLLLEKSGGGERHPVGQVVLYDRDSPAVCSNFVAKITLAAGMVPRFWMYQHAAAYARGVNIVAIKQTSGIQNLDQSQYFDERGVFPSQSEQVQIAKFLDRETAKIDALIAEQEKLLTLLAEKRQATISHAVTRGLNPNAPMRDSGIPWLGEVPAHWGVHSFRRELPSSISNGIFKKKDEFGSGALLVNVFDIYRPDFQVEYGGLDRVMCSDAEIDSYRVHAGDLFFVRSSLKVEGIAVAAVAPFCDEPAVYECHLIRARPRENSFNARFASYLFNSDPWRQHFIRSAKITTMTTIDQEAILSTPVLLPPYEEQMEISEFVHSELQRLDATRHSVDGAIVLLRERRSALIAAAVTGQIDVRGAEEARVA